MIEEDVDQPDNGFDFAHDNNNLLVDNQQHIAETPVFHPEDSFVPSSFTVQSEDDKAYRYKNITVFRRPNHKRDWQATHDSEIAAKREHSAELKRNTAAVAKKDIEKFYKDRNEKLAKNKATNAYVQERLST